MSQLRLFQIIDTSTKKPVPDSYFANKQLAKAERRRLNGDEDDGKLRFVVSPGPDHRNYKP